MDNSNRDEFWTYPASSFVDAHLGTIFEDPINCIQQLDDHEFRMFSLFDNSSPEAPTHKRKAEQDPEAPLSPKRPRQDETRSFSPEACKSKRAAQCIPMPRDEDARLLPLIFSVKQKRGHLAEYFWVPRIVWFVLGVVEVIQTDLASPSVLFESKSIIEAVSAAVVYMQKTGALDIYHFAPERNGSGLLELIIDASLKIQESTYKSNSLTQVVTDLIKPFRYKCVRHNIKSFKKPLENISKAFPCNVTPRIEYLYLIGDDDFKSDGKITAANGSNCVLYHAQDFTWNDMPTRRGFCYAFGYRATHVSTTADEASWVFKNQHMRCSDLAGRDLLCKAIEKFLLSEKYMDVARDVCCSSTLKDMRKFYFMGNRKDKLAKYSMMFSYMEASQQ